MNIEHMKGAVEIRLGREIDDAAWHWFTEVEDDFTINDVKLVAKLFQCQEAAIMESLAANAAKEASKVAAEEVRDAGGKRSIH